MLQAKIARHNISQNGGVMVPTWLLAGGIGAVIGGIFTPALMAATESGSRRLAEMSRQYISKK